MMLEMSAKPHETSRKTGNQESYSPARIHHSSRNDKNL